MNTDPTDQETAEKSAEAEAIDDRNSQEQSHSSAARQMYPESQRLLPWLLLLFVGSGCAALIYEIVWFQLLQLVIGLTTVSLGILLGTFMGGMCLGSWLLPKLIRPERHPLRIYACLELGIGLAGIGILFGVPWVSRIYTEYGGRAVSGMVLRGALAGLCLLPPTILMGGTLPAVARWIETTRQGVSWLGFFYGGNIVGAVAGSLLAGFYLLRLHDMATATYCAAAINLVVASTGLVLAARTRPGSSAQNQSLHPGASAAPAAWSIYVVIALSGMSALGAEVVWTRLLSLILGGTTYTFSIILAVFLIGLGFGSTAGAFLARTLQSPRRALGVCQLLLMLGIAWTALMIAHSIPYWPINPQISTSPWFTFQVDLVRCLWAILPAACLWGASFPLALAAVAAPGQDPGRVVGNVYAANTIGAIVGALAFSLFVIPAVGTRSAERLLIGLAAAAVIFTCVPPLWATRTSAGLDDSPEENRPRSGSLLVPGFAVGLAALLIWSVSGMPWGVVAYGRFMATYAPRLAPQIIPEKDVPSGGSWPDIYCNYVGEGLNGTVAVTKWKSGERNFHSAGKVQASTEPRDMRLQRMLGHLSALAHKRPESVLVVACGAGVTAGSFVLHPSINRIVICDIEPLVPKSVTPLFEKENYAVLKDPRTQVVFDDGRHFIRTSKEKFDIITSDPIDPWVKGCAALNTVDYYEICKAHLKPGGVMSLWFPLYESSSESAKSLIATFFKVFPNGSLWSNDTEGEGYDAVLLGQADPAPINLDEWQSRLGQPDHARVKESLYEVGFNSALSLLATYAGQRSDLLNWLQDAQINTDQNLRLQYLAGMWFNSYQGSAILAEIRQSHRFPDELFVGSDQHKKMLTLLMEGVSRGK